MAEVVKSDISPCPSPTQTRGTPARSQARITDFFPSDKSQKTAPVSQVTFLDLPAHVREMVYEAAGFGGNQFIDLNLWTIRNFDERWHDVNGEPFYPEDMPDDGWRDGTPYDKEPFPSALLWAGSRVIHDEVQTKLYSENTFAVSLIGSQGLHPLEMLSNEALGALRVLIISVCPCQCLTPYCSEMDYVYHGDDLFWDRPTHRDYWDTAQDQVTHGYHARPLSCISQTDKRILAQWERICRRLAANCRPDQLSLYLVANLADLPTTILFLAPLLNMPTLKDIAFNLGTHIHEHMSAKSKSMASQLVKGLTVRAPEQPFRFLDLPAELQIKILQETQLESTEEIYWTPDKRFIGALFCPDCRERQKSSISYNRNSGQPMSHETLFSTPIFCSRRHPTAFSRKCECLSSPLDYLLVSKAFSVPARAVFYKNKFVFSPEESNNLYKITGDWMEDYCLSLPSFLNTIPRDISNLRHICVIIPPMMPNYLVHQSEREPWEEWVHSFKVLEQQADLPYLKIEVHFADQDLIPLEDERSHLDYVLSRARLNRDEEKEKEMLDAYKRMLNPLIPLGPRLSALLVYVAWPLCETAHEQRKADERLLEAMIMGDEYDSSKWGKLDKSPFSQPKRFPSHSSV